MMMSMSLFTSAWNWNCSPSFLAGAASSDLMPTLTPAHGLEACAAAPSDAACCSRAVVCAMSAARARKSFISAKTRAEHVAESKTRQASGAFRKVTPPGRGVSGGQHGSRDAGRAAREEENGEGGEANF